jgi:16S rRNA (cytidine1402-2'-O)-methyltransferase
MTKGILYIVTTPIGNIADITLRAVRILNECDLIVCEEYKEAVSLLKVLGIEKELISINEHNEEEETQNLIIQLAEGKNIAFISDCGTPAFADPGLKIINLSRDYGIKTEFIHGANSVLTALVLCGFDISRFYFFGFLSPKSDIRKKQINGLKYLEKTIVLMDTPYRLMQVLEDLSSAFPERNIFIGTDLTTKSERHFRGTPAQIISEINSIFPDTKFKAEYIIIIEKQK